MQVLDLREHSSWFQVTETLEMLKTIESTGVNWITLHGRLKEERPRHDNHDDVIAQVSKEMKIPIIAKLALLIRFKFFAICFYYI